MKTNNKYLIGSSSSELLSSSGSSNVTTGGISRFIFNFVSSSRDLVTAGAGPWSFSSWSSSSLPIFLFSPRFLNPFVTCNWAASERTIGSGFTSTRDEGEIGKLIGGIFLGKSVAIQRLAHERLALFKVIGGNWSGMESNSLVISNTTIFEVSRYLQFPINFNI